MEQYLAIKKKYKNAVLFFRMGDFYEMFYNDAKIGAKVLGIALTNRAHGKAADVPLAGFPHHALDVYLAKMIKAGYRVAVCEQLEDPKKAKTVVKRDVVEVVTPGTAVTEDLLDTKRNNFLVSVCFSNNVFGLAQIDVSTGEFLVLESDQDDLKEWVFKLNPAELLISENQQSQILEKIGSLEGVTITSRDDWAFQYDFAYDTLLDHFGTVSLKGFGIETKNAAISAAGATIAYLKDNQKERLVHINRIGVFPESDYMTIDSTTKRNLELVSSMTVSGRSGTLISIMDQTNTPMGGRMLVHWISYPLIKIDRINQRLNAVEHLIRENRLRETLAEHLKGAGDLERLIAKFVTGRANAKDAMSVSATCRITQKVKKLLSDNKIELLSFIQNELAALDDLLNEIERAIKENPPLSITEGGLIKDGYNQELDKLREIAYSGKDWIARLQVQERKNTGIPSLKVNFNKVFGYYIEVTKPHLAKVPSHYIRKQTLVNAERFITQELKEYEEKVLGAEEKIATLEYELFNKLRNKILNYAHELQSNAHQIAVLDCLVSFAIISLENKYSRPEMLDSDEIVIKEGRHPVVEKVLPAGEQFVSNDTKMDNTRNQILIVTGPNMAGKSTYLRQVGLIVIMAHMGCFIPAQQAKLGLVDRVFTRVGASDNLAAGESTFLREMNETANILNNATPKSLVLLDEIGRGTSTFDGLSIAWSVTEYLHNTPQIAAKTIFATHYHELTELELLFERVKNYNIAVREWGDHIVFLRKIVPGGCDHSYGIHVAQLAGLPKPVIRRAKEILKNLESESLTPDQKPKLAKRRPETLINVEQMSLFSELENKLRNEIEKIDPNNLTPMEALSKLDQLKTLVNDTE
jgi:DNA mismatch repair protein MutS